MGMLANYMLADDEAIDELKELSEDDLVEFIEELDEAGSEVYDMDKLWDGLHFLLTGASASAPIEGNPLSEAIVGVHVFDADDDYVSWIETGEITAIAEALRSVDIKTLTVAADFSEFSKAKLYPGIWQAEDADGLRGELTSEFEGIKAFYEKAIASGKHVIVSIY
jgi:hypothetical protein